MSLVVVSSARFADHVAPPGHPERAERAQVMRKVALESEAGGATLLEPRVAAVDEICRVHEAQYVSGLLAAAGRAVALDPDTFTSPQSIEVALLAAGAGLTAVDAVLAAGGPRRAFALVRPPGHHAEADRAMGFCLFNNVAVAAAHARAAGLERVAIVDYDVHHGNGTQHMFDDDPAVLFISSHQFPYYPGSGAASEIGVRAGRGFTLNLPLEAGAGDADYELVYRDAVVPALRQFRPELILLSAGYDALRDDPLGGMQVSAGQFGRLTTMLASVADECCDGRFVGITEGGYQLQGLGDCLRASLQALSVERAKELSAGPGGPALRGEASIAALRSQVSGIWTI